VFWDGVLGVTECSAFQTSTRAIVTTLMQVHDEKESVVIINGGTTSKWIRLFSGLDDPPEVSHIIITTAVTTITITTTTTTTSNSIDSHTPSPTVKPPRLTSPIDSDMSRPTSPRAMMRGRLP